MQVVKSGMERKLHASCLDVVVAFRVGALVGFFVVGAAVAIRVGALVGSGVVGADVGASVGSGVGAPVGIVVVGAGVMGAAVASAVGAPVSIIVVGAAVETVEEVVNDELLAADGGRLDRKSTRLNSSHVD